MMSMRVCMVPMRSTVGDIDGNVGRILGYCDTAQDGGADLVCFPEMSVTGYSMPRSRDFLLSERDDPIRRIVERSASGLSICFGYADAGGRIAQSVAEDGEIAGTYRKTHLGEREQGVMVPGEELPVLPLKRAIVGISICWEAHFPEICGTYALKGADLVLMPTASGLGGERRQSSWGRVLPARAYDNTVFVAACNACGDNGLGTVLGGGACAYDVRGMELGHTLGDGILFADLDPGQMDRIRGGASTTMRDVYFLDKRRPELYSELVRKNR